MFIGNEHILTKIEAAGFEAKLVQELVREKTENKLVNNT